MNINKMMDIIAEDMRKSPSYTALPRPESDMPYTECDKKYANGVSGRYLIFDEKNCKEYHQEYIEHLQMYMAPDSHLKNYAVIIVFTKENSNSKFKFQSLTLWRKGDRKAKFFKCSPFFTNRLKEICDSIENKKPTNNNIEVN